MPLTNFGAILNFAETLERTDMDVYHTAGSAPASAPYRELLVSLAKEAKKNIALVQRTRRENVTEMILEPIHDFTRQRYQIGVGDVGEMDREGILAAVVALEERAVRYYSDAAEKIRALPEVSRALKTLAKKHDRQLAQLKDL